MTLTLIPFASNHDRPLCWILVYETLAFIFPVQAEAEELAVKVESLNADNMTLKSEISRLTEISEKLKLENALLTVHHHLICFLTFD